MLPSSLGYRALGIPLSRGATTSSRSSQKWCVIPTRQRFLTSPIPMAPRALGCASTVYVYLYCFFIVLVFNLSLNFEIFQALFMRDNTDEQTSNRHLEAYLLWLIAT
jgi:hypothetical protein